jgi:hypoxanthine-DNA glycosylase
MAARRVKSGLAPAIAPSARVLLLGSFPGEESLRQRQYYAHPRNHFWRLLGDVLETDLAGLPYARRLALLRRHRIGLWDIITDCERDGSLDGSIRNATLSQFDWLAKHAPKLRVVAMNGKKAGTAQARLAALGYRTLVLPSSSPAYTLAYADKLRAWRALAAELQKSGSESALNPRNANQSGSESESEPRHER